MASAVRTVAKAKAKAKMHKTSTRLADGRELIYYDRRPGRRAPADTRDLPAPPAASRLRYDVRTGEWVVVADHRQDRTFQPSAEDCPLCPSRAGRLTEIPAADYDIVVFENRFPALTMPATAVPPTGPPAVPPAGTLPAGTLPAGVPVGADCDPLMPSAPATGRCEVVCFSSVHDESFADLDPEQVRLVLEVWADRTGELSALPGVVQVFCFENRGPEMGVTQPHPHGQIYAYPFVTPRTARMLGHAEEYHHRHGGNLFDDLLAAEHADGARVVAANGHWTAFVPYAARWPFEVHLYPLRRRRDLTGLDDEARDAFPEIYLDLVRRFARLFDTPAPYVAAWHQAPAGVPGADGFAVHLELFTNRRSSGRLKVQGGTEVAMDAFSNDIGPEQAAERLRKLGD